MTTFEKMYSMGHEEVVFFSDSSCNLKVIVAIHNTTLGPALGGTRLWPYAKEEDALEDVLRLSRGMTYKAAISGLNLGGGKAVIIADPKKDKSEALFRSYGRFLESLNGRYITAEDVNINVNDIEYIFMETDHVAGVSHVHGGSGDPSPFTAMGVIRGMEASCLKVFGDKSLKNKVVAIQGVGAVGRHLAEMLTAQGASLVYTDINETNIHYMKEHFPKATFVHADEIHKVNCDIYAPCALGGAINEKTINELKCKIVAGSANNQLAKDEYGQELRGKNILYAPDYLINAGGLMNVSLEFEGWSDAKARRMTDSIYNTTIEVINTSYNENIPTNRAADLVAQKRLEAIRHIKNPYQGNVPTRIAVRRNQRPRGH
jgi:leucine dehydrogenase